MQASKVAGGHFGGSLNGRGYIYTHREREISHNMFVYHNLLILTIIFFLFLQITLRNIESTMMEIKILQLPPPTVQSVSPDPRMVFSDHNQDI